MASVVRNSSVALKLLGFGKSGGAFLAASKILKTQSAGLALKGLRDFEYATPFPYKEKDYSLIASIFDKTSWRFNENSKIIVVDGPVASGKSKLAKEIAEAYDLLYIPHVNLDSFYINAYGYDLRQLNDQLPFKCRSLDIHEFLQNPRDERVGIMQHLLYRLRLGQYIDALNHVLNTGQGVVLDRSIFSDSVFVDTFVKFGFLSESFRTYINLINEALMPQIMKPHLMIYLDSPVDVTLQRIKERSLPGEKDSPIYKPEVLKYMEAAHKQMLQKMEKNCELLVYDWSEERNPEIVIEDLENVNLDDYPHNDNKMRDWRKEAEYDWTEYRQFYLQKKESHFLFWTINIPCLYCPELQIDGADINKFHAIMENAPGMKYRPGFNTDMGDESTLLRI